MGVRSSITVKAFSMEHPQNGSLGLHSVRNRAVVLESVSMCGSRVAILKSLLYLGVVAALMVCFMTFFPLGTLF